MFAYLIIGVELALIYAVFWYVFVRDTKPNISESTPWERYPRNAGNFTAYGAQETLFGTSSSPIVGGQIAKYAPCNLEDSANAAGQSGKKAVRHHAKTECSCALATSRKRPKSALSSRKSSTASEGSFVERICLYLGRKLIQFSIRIS
jgi:hypothetical protein